MTQTASSRKKPKQPQTGPTKEDNQARWVAMQLASRNGIARTLEAIRNGEVGEDELNKLNNFCQISLMLMERSRASDWEVARRNAAIASEAYGGNYVIYDTYTLEEQHETEQTEHACQEQADLAAVED
jgi:hypothetical protein